jgi:hypothetical protein
VRTNNYWKNLGEIILKIWVCDSRYSSSVYAGGCSNPVLVKKVQEAYYDSLRMKPPNSWNVLMNHNYWMKFWNLTELGIEAVVPAEQ